MTDHINSPDPHRGPYSDVSDEDLSAAYEREAVEPDSLTGPLLLAELQHRGLAED